MRTHRLTYLWVPLVLWIASGFRETDPDPIDRVVTYARLQFHAFADETLVLKAAIDSISDGDAQSVVNARRALRDCRIQYKKISFFLDYFFDFATRAFNAPPTIEVEEPSMEYDEPSGLQVLEALLYDDSTCFRKHEMQQHADFIASSAADLHALLYQFRADKAQLLESVRLELIRIATLTLAGFDAPLLKSGIDESHASLSALQFVLEPYMHETNGNAFSRVVQEALDYLEDHRDFDSFDRLFFLTEYAIPLQTSLDSLAESQGLAPGAKLLRTTRAKRFFSAGQAGNNPEVARLRPALGKALFFDSRLSGDGSRSCATCHQPARYFTDGLPRSRAIDGKSFVERNAPTLLYASWQYRQFWDGRAKSLEEQTAAVLGSPLEMNSSPRVVIAALSADSAYAKQFRDAFPGADSVVSMRHIGQAIASFVRTLGAFDAPFDRYLEGDRHAMTPSQVRGFNLFMGKAGCGTCHFPPLFNGSLPPRYDVTEFESLGVPATENLDSPVADDDNGRYNVFHIPFQRGLFKTPTLRNVAMTAPYMHNGSFTTLESVIEFYDRGGGAGIGLPSGNQTLPAQPLHLSSEEKSDIVEFLRALTDPRPSREETIAQP